MEIYFVSKLFFQENTKHIWKAYVKGFSWKDSWKFLLNGSNQLETFELETFQPNDFSNNMYAIRN